MPSAAVAAASAAFYAAGHVYEGGGAVVLAAVQAVVFSAIFLRFRRLHLLAISHALFNVVALALTLLPGPSVL